MTTNLSGRCRGVHYANCGISDQLLHILTSTVPDFNFQLAILLLFMMAEFNVRMFESDDDKEIINYIARRRRAKRYSERFNYFDALDDGQFFIRFRLQKPTVVRLLMQIEYLIEFPTDRNRSISPITKLLLALRFYAVGTMLLAIGDFSGVSKSSACVIVKQVSEAVALQLQHYVYLPRTNQEKEDTVRRFFEFARFPNVIGAIDYTHVKIQSPGGDDAEYYRNRKGYFSWNVQTVCDGNLRILDIVARWPGSTHDQTIFNNSTLKTKFLNDEMENFILVGDSGYGVTNYLLTPLQAPATPAELLYNESQIRTRNAVERSYGVWKRRFPILSLGMRLEAEKTKTVIVATAILHNLAIEEIEVVPPIDLALGFDTAFFHENADEVLVAPRQIEHGAKRTNLIQNYFSNLL